MRALRVFTLSRTFAKSSAKVALAPTGTSLSSLDKTAPQETQEESIHPYNEYDPIKSLFLQYKNIEDIDATQVAILNKKTFEDGLKSPRGPLSLLSEAEKQKIDFLATQRLRELEESGLSREEVLGLPGKGVPLTHDPFFQIIKNDLKVRVRLFKEGEEYSVKRIVLRALQQDIGHDPSPAGTGQRIRSNLTAHNTNTEQTHPDAFKDERSADYFVSDATPSVYDYHQKDSLDLYRPFLKKDPGLRVNKISINVNDIHWRNTPLLAKFMTNTGRIKHRFKTGVNKETFLKVRRAIKQARALNLLPSAGFMKPYHKIPLRNLIDDLNDDVTQSVDLEHGNLIKRTPENPKDFRRDHFTFLYGMMEPHDSTTVREKQKLIENARTYAIYLKQNFLRGTPASEKIFIDNQDQTDALKELKVPIVSPAEAEKCRPAYEKLSAQFKELPLSSFMDLLFAEHLQDIEPVFALKEAHDGLKEKTKELSEVSYDDLLAKIQELKKAIPEGTLPQNKSFFNSEVEKTLVNLITKADKQ